MLSTQKKHPIQQPSSVYIHVMIKSMSLELRLASAMFTQV